MNKNNRSFFETRFPEPLEKPILSLEKKQGYSKISAILLLTAIVIASAITFLLVKNTAV